MAMKNEGDSSPWGKIQDVYPVTDGMEFVSTASHGGLKLSRAMNAKMPNYMRLAGGWYEEDCEWARVFCVFEKEILATPGIDKSHIQTIEKGDHKAILRAYCPEEYEKFYGVTLKDGESYERDKENFEKAHANDFVVISALGDDYGKVKCTATRGGIRGHGAEHRNYLIPKEQYDTRSQFGFVIDEQRHVRMDEATT